MKKYLPLILVLFVLGHIALTAFVLVTNIHLTDKVHAQNHVIDSIKSEIFVYEVKLQKYEIACEIVDSVCRDKIENAFEETE